ncbi:hypothetical protein LTR05_007463 [Lithohypha guttulata]|uniref:Uncharacterized protein n=1 Tax=Lithohypha guttulata TaxID=1690604 RepID=A0AAN7SW08_9EURO|nr:hypothetical protein LTR05_007463 [Lithohypha guttulata]
MPRQKPLPAITTTLTAAAPNISTSKPSVESSSRDYSPASVVEAKIVVIGAQGVGKTSLVQKFVNPNASVATKPTIGAEFVTKKLHDSDTNTTVRLQVWDTAGQERFRSISRLYYRGAHAGILCYDVTSESSWEEMKEWLEEIRQNCEFSSNESKPGTGMILHVVGTKVDLVVDDPSKRQVSFERTITYVAEHLAGLNLVASTSSTPPLTMKSGNVASNSVMSPDSKRSSIFWTQDPAWDSCHEVSARDNDGIEEVFRVIAKKLIDQRNKRVASEQSQTPWPGSEGDYFSHQDPRSANTMNTGSFRLGHGHRRSWLGLPGVAAGLGIGGDNSNDLGNGSTANSFTRDPEEARRRGRCC